MISLQYDRPICITVGSSRKSTKWAPQPTTVSVLYSRLEIPQRGVETITDYLALSKSEQDDRKDVGGFVGGRLTGPRRKADSVEYRDVITLDVDTIPPYGGDTVRTQAETLGCGYLIYPTRKDRPAAPRKRLIVPANRSMTVDEYDAVSRRLAAQIGIEMCDPSTFEAARLMYWPSCCSDSDYRIDYKDAPLLDVDAVLASYADWRDYSERPQVPGAVNFQRLAVKAGDPLTKPGIIGAFCRTYDVYAAMTDLLPGIYTPCDNDPRRFTFTQGSTTGGAVVYDDGKFLYSHHATDPCGGKLVNAADLVRLHKFGQLDDEAPDGTPVNRLPSYKAFCTYALEDKKVATLLAKERYDAGQLEFAGVGGQNPSGSSAAAPAGDPDGGSPGDGDGGDGGPATPQTDADPDAWLVTSGLQINPRTGAVLPTIDNIRIILENDAMLKGRFALNAFAGRGEVLGVLPWDQEGKRRLWSDTDVNGIYWYLERRFNITKRPNIDAALDIHAATHAFNDVQDYLNGLSWDGVPRLDTLFIDYLGAEDDDYNRAVCRKAFTAAVARAMDPGCKFDNMLILCGRQGIGKSTILDRMSRGWFNDSIRTFEGKEASELLQGVWLVEVAELDAFRRSDVACIKQFLSLRADRYRAAYGRNVKELPRCCVFFGTCNQLNFLQDTTGNRRFWPVDVGVNPSTLSVWKDLTDEVVDQLWAEAKIRWQIGEPLYLAGDIETRAQERQEAHRETNPKEGMITDFVTQEVPEDWSKWPIERRRDYWARGIPAEKTVKRTRIAPIEVWCELFNLAPRDIKNLDAREINAVLARMPGLKPLNKPFRCGPYGTQRGFDIQPEKA